MTFLIEYFSFVPFTAKELNEEMYFEIVNENWIHKMLMNEVADHQITDDEINQIKREFELILEQELICFELNQKEEKEMIESELLKYYPHLCPICQKEMMEKGVIEAQHQIPGEQEEESKDPQFYSLSCKNKCINLKIPYDFDTNSLIQKIQSYYLFHL